MPRKIKIAAKPVKKEKIVEDVTFNGSIELKPYLGERGSKGIGVEERLTDLEPQTLLLDLERLDLEDGSLSPEQRKEISKQLDVYREVIKSFVDDGIKEMNSFIRGSKKARGRARKNISQAITLIKNIRTSLSPKNFPGALVELPGDKRREVSEKNFKGNYYGKILKEQREKANNV